MMFPSPPSPPSPTSTAYFSSNSSFNDLPSLEIAAPPVADDYIRISVSDPLARFEPASPAGPAGPYVTFLLTSKTLARPSGDIRVRRRFRDVSALSDRISASYRGFFIPSPPEFGTAEGQVVAVDALERWLTAVERYLWRLAAHPVIGKGAELKTFLELDEDLDWMPTVVPPATVFDGLISGEPGGSEIGGRAAKGGRELIRVFKELKQVVVNEFGGPKALVMEEDEEFLERKESILDFEHALVQTSLQAEALVKAQQDIGETMGEMGLAFAKLSKFEIDNAMYYSQIICSTDNKLLATAAVQASTLYQELNVQSVRHLDTLHEYLELMLAVKNAFSDRAGVLLTIQTLMSDLCSLQTKREKLEVASPRKFDGARLQKLEELYATIKEKEDARRGLIKQLEKIKENNRIELERMDRERPEDFLSMLKGFAMNQGLYAEKIASAWVTVAEETSAYLQNMI